MQGLLWSSCAGCSCSQSHLLKTTQMDGEAYLQEMQEDSDKKATSQPQLDQKLQAIMQTY